MDLDRFKEVNETFGHHNGDLLLKQVAERLAVTLRESDTVARLGGDEFAMLMPGTAEQGATLAAERVLDSMTGPFTLDGQDLDIAGSIGVVVFPDHGRDLATLMRGADTAMYEAKRASGCYAVYSGDREDGASKVLMKAELRHAIERNDLILHYQPKVDLATGQTRQVEALVRWLHPDRGMIPPDAFVPLADQSGMMKSLTLWVLNESLRQRKVWEAHGIDLIVAVNFSARTLDMDLVRSVDQLLSKWETDSSRLVVEVTESAIMTDTTRSLQTLTALHDVGVTISIDDFGTGQSSLAYLKQLPVDEIKIDKSFVLDMSNSRDDASIVRTVVDLGHNFDLVVVAEGVDNKRSIGLLREMHCDLAQGFYLSRPLEGEALLAWLLHQEARQLSAS
jgi:diguanylate cyclase (GGDEF)-like protein